MKKRITELEVKASEILNDISKLNLMIYTNADDSEKVRNLSNGINNSIKTLANLFQNKVDKIKRKIGKER